MKPVFWIGILAIIGSLSGTALSIFIPAIDGSTAATTGTIIGVVAGTLVYVTLGNKRKE